MIKRQNEQGEMQYIEFKVGPFTMKFGGRELFNVVVILMAIGFIAYFIHQHDDKTEKALVSTIKAVDENTQSLDVLIYVNSLPIEERSKLNIQKPRKLREMENGNGSRR